MAAYVCLQAVLAQAVIQTGCCTRMSMAATGKKQYLQLQVAEPVQGHECGQACIGERGAVLQVEGSQRGDPRNSRTALV